MNVISVIGIGVITAALSLTLKEKKGEYSFLISTVGGVIIIVSAILLASPFITSVSEFVTENDKENLKIVVKSLGICYISAFASDACRDAGETSVASKIEIYSKIAVLAVAYPLFTELFETAKGLLK